ncbi:MAG: CHAD domain-containing protein [Bacteroidales bacterium]|nr:CHAD domain-containing protein [Bacteroidales bacterium]
MAAHESIHEYYLHQHRNIEHYLELCLSLPEAELVHELRLSIKKLRAFHKLAEQINSGDQDEPIYIKHRVRKLYKVAGQLRDTQVQIHLLTGFEEQTGIEYPEFGKWLLMREKKRISRFGRKPQQLVPHSTTPGTHEKIGNLLAQATDVTILTGAGKALAGLYSKAQELSFASMNDQNLHLIRTLTKQMKYISNIMNHSYIDFIFREISVAALHEIEVAAGHWHDNLVRIKLLGKFMEKLKSDDNIEKFKYQKLYDACKSELDISYGETYRIVRKAFSPKDQGYESI